jgi:hypothetical protein
MSIARRLRLVAVVLLATPLALVAQGTHKNLTGLPMYPTLTNGTQYPASQTQEGKFQIYTAETKDALDIVESWYRRALPKAKEARDDNNLTHGIVLTNGKDKVLVYQLGKSKGSVVELQKYVGS